MTCRTTQDGWIIVESSDKTSPTRRGDDKSLQFSCENSKNSMKRQKDMTEDELSRSEGVTYAIREERKAITKNQYADHSLSNSMKLSHAMWVHPRQTGHGGEVCQNMVNRTR